MLGNRRVKPTDPSSVHKKWESKLTSTDLILDKIEPGMKIFIGTGVAEPRTLVKSLIESDKPNLFDLEIIQILSFGEAVSAKIRDNQKFRLKTFFSGWLADEAITEGRVDLIPGYFHQIPSLIRTGQMPVDIAFIQITPPNDAGYCNFGVSMDAAREAMAKASIVVGEINDQIPLTYGDTFVPVTDFDFLVHSQDPPYCFNRWPVEAVFEKIAVNIAMLIDDGCCLAFTIGPLYEALAKNLTQKRNLGVHTPFFTDALMDLVNSGAITNRNKAIFQGKSLTSYALGTNELFNWLDSNPLVEFQSTEKVLNPVNLGSNSKLVAIVRCRKVDLSGRIAITVGKGNVANSPGEILNVVLASRISTGGLSIFALPARNRDGQPNILLSLKNFEDQFSIREAVDLIVTEYGVAVMSGRTLRERAQGLIEIAHPDDREMLFNQAREHNLLYKDQIFLASTSSLYPSEITAHHTFEDGLTVRFRAIKPSDEEDMRYLFYRFSDEAVYYRYFTHVKAMPHTKMQQYVNIDYSQTMSIVGKLGEVGKGRIIAEARYVKHKDIPYADVAFVVDEVYKGRGIGTYLFKMLVRLAKERGLQGFTADVLQSNKAMLKVFEKCVTVRSELDHGEYHLTMPFYADSTGNGAS